MIRIDRLRRNRYNVGMKFFSLYLWLVLFAGAAGAEVPLGELPSVDVMTMVQDIRCKQVVVTCLVNGQPLRMLLDTGASHTVLHRESAETLQGVRWIDTSQMQFRGNAKQKPGMLVASLLTGVDEAPEHSFLVLDLSAVRASMVEQVDGILGMDVLGRLPFTFDLRTGDFYWGVPENVQAVPLSGRADRFGRLLVHAECQGKVLELLLDTGSSVTRVHPDMWPAGSAGLTTAQVGDVNAAARLQVQMGKPADLLVAPGVVLSGVKPLFGSPGQPTIIGMDSLQGIALIHVPLDNSLFGAFFVAK